MIRFNKHFILAGAVSIFLGGCNEQNIPKSSIYQPEIDMARQAKPFMIPKQEGLNVAPEWKKKIDFEIGTSDNVLNRLVDLAKKNNIALNIHYDIDNLTNLVYKAKNKPILDVIEDICAICGWKLTLSRNAIFINRDTPYLHIHSVNLLNSSVQSSVQTGISFYEQKDGKGRRGITNSATSLDTKANNDIWGEIEMYLKFLVTTYKQDRYDSKIAKDEVAERYKVKQEQGLGDLDVAELSRTARINDNEADQSDLLEKLSPKNDDVKKVADVSVTKDRTADIAFSLNKQAGLIILKAPQYVHKEVARYLSAIEEKMSMQIRFEVRIIEVDLFDTYEAGINWDNVMFGNNVKGENSFVGSMSGVDNAGSGAFKFTMNKNVSVAGLISALQQYGTTHTISKPELMIVQNEVGLFKVVKNNVYFELQSQAIAFGKDAEITGTVVTSKPHIIPEGFSMTIQPAVDRETGEVIVHIKPSNTFVSSWISDPAIAINRYNHNNNGHFNSNVKSEFPVLSAREFDTKLRLKAGEWAVLGGHVIKKNTNSGSGLPGVKTSYLGSALGKKKNEEKTTEIVCLIRGFPESNNFKSLKNRLVELYSQKNSVSKLESITD